MAASRLKPVIQHLRRATLRLGLSDGQLLERFIASRDEAAFEALVRRHGPMILGVCRRVLHNHHDAEDAFQATFLVLARKAASVCPREMVGNWLYGVAHTTALRARVANAKRKALERQAADMPRQEPVRDDLLPLLEQELSRLPDKYRSAIVLCDLEGRTRREVAQQLKIPEGTLSSRLTTGHRMLAKRLARHGLAGAGGSVLSQAAAAKVPAALTTSTVRAANLLATGQAVGTGVVSVQVAALTEGVMKAMLLTKLKAAMAVLTLAVLACYGVGVLTYEAAGQSGPAEGQPSLLNARSSDQESLHGVWRVVSAEMGGKPADFGKAVLMVRGDRVCWQTADGDLLGGLYLDPTSRPKAYDFATYLRTDRGIYSLDGDTLRLCYDLAEETKRPRRFATGPGAQQVLVVLQRDRTEDIRDYRRPDGTLAFPTLVEQAGARPQATPPLQLLPKQVQAPQPAVRQAKVGEVMIVGNDKTPDAVIRKHLPLLPGQPLDYAALRTAEKNLATLRLFVVDPQKGIRPTVQVIDRGDNSEYKDVLVTVQEVPAKGAASRTLKEEAEGLREALHRLEQHLAEVKEAAVRQALEEQVHDLQQRLQRLHQRLPDTDPVAGVGLGRAMPQGVGKEVNSAAGLAGSIVLNERTFQVPLDRNERTFQVPLDRNERTFQVPLNRINAQQAEKDFKIAEFYRQAGHPGSAAFYYEVVCRRYPGTTFADRAQQRLNDLRSRPKE